METLNNVMITYIVYHSEDGEYAVLRGYHELSDICLTGSLCQVTKGSKLDVVGNWKRHPKYGVQFEVYSYEECLPTDMQEIERYLINNGIMFGVGEYACHSIVAKFGLQTLDVLNNVPSRLREVTGLTPNNIEQVVNRWNHHKTMREIRLFLSAFGLSSTMISRIMKAYPENTIGIIQENPYCLADDIEGITFQMADIIALGLGLSNTNYKRCRSGILYYLSTIGKSGHCYTSKLDVLRNTSKLLTLPMDLLERAMVHMETDGDIVIDGVNKVYPKMYYDYEKEIANHVKRIMTAEPREFDLGIQVDDDIEYTEGQKNALEGALDVNNSFVIITGGPGTGKTTMIKGIVNRCVANKKTVLLASPTGRAANVLSIVTGELACTVHRLLDYKPGLGFGYTDKVQLSGDVLIVDEVSMIDLVLMRHLMQAIADGMKVILVGDVDQIPSVGAGNILYDMISSGVIPVYRLEHIFRQNEGSTIRLAAHNINKGVCPDLSNPKGANFFFFRNLDETEVAEMIIKLRTDILPKKYGLDAVNDIHVVAPMYKGEVGVSKLNQLLQKNLNPSEDGLKLGMHEFYLNDKVMQVRNDYDNDVFNGMFGKVKSINVGERKLNVSFGTGEEIEYDGTSVDDLDLGYATTVHKAQGSEYPVVIIPLVQTHANMWYRKLLYTAVTRAKQLVILIGSPNVLYVALSNTKDSQRNTSLCERLREVFV